MALTGETDVYLSIAGPVNESTKVKGSRFLGFAAPVLTQEDAHAFLSTISKKYHDATHVCFAWQAGLPPADVRRYSDAGEPSGTAGLPIMEAIQGRKLTHLICVIVRYFGGTKLGTGGLARAYGDCAALTLDAARVTRHYQEEKVRVQYPYGLTGQVMHLLNQPGITVLHSEYDTDVVMHIKVRKSQMSFLCHTLVEQSAGRVAVQTGASAWT